MAFEQLEEHFIKNHLKALLCSPIVCSRDKIGSEYFAHNIVNLQQSTGATVGIILYMTNHQLKDKLEVFHIAYCFLEDIPWK